MNYDTYIDKLNKAVAKLIRQHHFIAPADAMHVVTANRCVQTIGAFRLLIENGGYMTAVTLVRQQLDNLIRLFGITSQPDPHMVAYEVLNGTPLSKINWHGSKQKMRDAHLKMLMADPWLNSTYDVCSDFVHLSWRHFSHLLGRSDEQPGGVVIRVLKFGDQYVDQPAKDHLVELFEEATLRNVTVVHEWINNRFAKISYRDSVATWGTAWQKQREFGDYLAYVAYMMNGWGRGGAAEP